MRKINQEITDSKQINDILEQSDICRLSFIDQGIPYIVPMNYGYQDNCLYLHSAPTGKKIELAKDNDSVCFEIEQYSGISKHEIACKWSTIYRSIIGYGKIEIITDLKKKEEGLKILMAHNGAPELVDFDQKQIDAVVILKLQITSLTAKQSNNWNKYHTPQDYTLTSERVILKEVGWEDLETLHSFRSIPEVDAFNTLGIPKNLAETRNVLASVISEQSQTDRKFIYWTVREKATNKLMGDAGIFLSGDRFNLGEIFYNLAPQYWGVGYGTEIAKMLINFGFEKMKLHKIEAGVATGNSRSVKVLEKAGMTKEGLRRKILPIRGEWVDNYHYAILESDPRK